MSTTLSPTSAGELPSDVTVIGGIVADLIGLNDTRVVTQLSASSLFEGFFNTGTPVSSQGNPGTIGIQSGFDASLLDQLGGGLSELAVRVTLDEGDSGIGDFDEGQENSLLVNGQNVGFFGEIDTNITASDGTIINPSTGFPNEELATGFFFTDDATILASIFSELEGTNELIFQVQDDSPFDNFYDFTAGIDGSLIDIGTGPVITPPPASEMPDPEPPASTPPATTVIPTPSAALGGFIGFAALAARRRKAEVE
ncbi:MAG: hypothetical protein AAGH99_15200 [Planctomycetota bacterium]